MLALTQDATKAIGGILAAPGIPEQAGVRIAPLPPSRHGSSRSITQLLATVVDRPNDGDAVIEQESARLFLPEHVLDYLADKLLDAHREADGPQFVLARQR